VAPSQRNGTRPQILLTIMGFSLNVFSRVTNFAGLGRGFIVRFGWRILRVVGSVFWLGDAEMVLREVSSARV
jgi:hypothetical protein